MNKFYSQLRNGSKMGNRKHTCNQGHEHASVRESRRCDELTMLQNGNVITNLQQQPQFVLQNKFKWEGKVIREIKYIADFMYIEDGKVIVEDSKGFRDKVFILKKKMLLKYFVDNNLNYIFKET